MRQKSAAIALLEFLTAELRSDASLRSRADAALLGAEGPVGGARRKGRRPPGPLDPFVVYQGEPEALHGRLDALTLDQLKDIVAEHGMDHARLAMKWKDKGRLVDLIESVVKARSKKGDAFRS